LCQRGARASRRTGWRASDRYSSPRLKAAGDYSLSAGNELAMVAAKILLPNQDAIDRLSGLGAPLHIYHEKRHLDRTVPPLFFNSDSDNNFIALSVEWQDVRFKFEVFNLELVRLPIAMPHDLHEIARFDSWNRISCVIACEWERPARRSEVPSSWEQTVQERGLRGELPPTATAVGISMVGIIFDDTVRNLPTGMIYHDADPPCSLHVTQDPEGIRRFIANCETVIPARFPAWKRNLLKWCKSIGAEMAGRAARVAG